MTKNNYSDIKVNDTNLIKDVYFLTSLKPARNFYNLESLNKAADYIKTEFEKTGLKVQEQKFKVQGNEYKNIISSFSGKSKERIIIGAHYDVAGEQPGADDNASGIAGILELARLLNENKSELNYPVDLIAYSLEEPPIFASSSMGSAVHAKSIFNDKIKIKLMLSLEMIGYFTNKSDSQDLPLPQLKLLYPSVGNFIGVVGKTGQEKTVESIKQLMLTGSNIDVQSISAPESLPGVSLSDHRNYWYYNYNALMITDTSFFRNPNYHTHTDTLDTLDFNRMAEVIKGVYHVIINL